MDSMGVVGGQVSLFIHFVSVRPGFGPSFSLTPSLVRNSHFRSNEFNV